MKKIILLTMIIMLMTGCLASAQELEISDYESADIFVSSIVGEDLFSGTENETIQRGDFVTAVAKLFKQQIVYTGDPIFSDVPETDVNYEAISNACSYGWVSKANQFFPYNPIKVNEAVKLIVCAADYDVHAQNAGGYPDGYLVTAHKMNLLDGIGIRGNEELTVRDALIMLSNALKAEAIGISTITADNVQYDFMNVPIVEQLYGLKCTEGVVTQINKRSLVFNAECNADVVKIDGDIYFGSGLDHKWLGYNVKAWHDEDRNIVAIVPCNNVSFTVDIKDFLNINATRFNYGEGNKEKYKNLDASYMVMCNDVRVGALIDAYYADLNGSITLVDNNDDRKYDVIFVESYEYAIVDNVDPVKGQIGLVGSNAILDFEEAEECTLNSVDGSGIELYDVNRGQYAILKKSPYIGSEIVNSYVPEFFEATIGSEVFTGKITGLQSSENLVFINNTAYNISKLFRDEFMPSLAIGNDVMYAVGLNNDLIYAEKIVSTSRYGYVLKLYSNDSDETYFIKLLADTGVIETYRFAEKVYVDGIRDSSHTVYVALGGTAMERQLIRYSLNADGLLYKIDLSEDASTLPFGEKRESDNNLLKYTSAPTKIKYKTTGNLFAPKFSIEGAVIFKVPQITNPQYEDYEVVSLNSLLNENSYTVDAFNINEYGAAGAVLIYTTDTKPISSAANSYLVESVSTVVGADGEVGRNLHTWLNGKYYDFFVPDDVVVENTTDNSITPGDIVRIWNKHAVIGGEVQRMVMDIDNTDSGIVCKYTAQINSHTVEKLISGANNLAGYIYAVGESGIVVGLNAVDDGTMNFNWNNVQSIRYTDPSLINVAYIDSATGRIESGTINSLRTYQSFGTECHYAIIKMNSQALTSVYIYE